jgi:CubicO group peptidase (beta-lactamase class C family)
MQWHEFIERRLLEPLAMGRSRTTAFAVWDRKFVAPTFLGSVPGGTPDMSAARDADVAMPHGFDAHGAIVPLPWQSYDDAAAAGSMVSSVADMANWLVLHLDMGRFRDRQIVRAETVKELHAIQNLHVDRSSFPFEETGEGYAMGWRRAEYRGHVHLAHSGGMLGFPAYVALIPDLRIGVVVLSNGPKPASDEYTLHKAIAFWVFDRLMGAPVRNWSEEFLRRSQNAELASLSRENRLDRERLRDRAASLPLQRYVGSYEDGRGRSGRIGVTLEHGALTLRFNGEGAFSAPLEHWQSDVFRLRPSPTVADVLGPQLVAFDIDPAGRVVSMSAFGALFQPLSETAARPDR